MANAQKTQPNDAANTGNAAQDKTQNKTGNSGTANQGGTNQGTAPSGDLGNQVGNIISGDTGAVKDVLNQAKESTGQAASQAYDAAAKKATSVIDEQKTNLAQGLNSVAGSIRQVGDSLRSGNQDNQARGVVDVTARYGDSIATQVEQLSRYLERKDLRELSSDVERFARRNPAVFLGGAFALGLLAARFLKSGNPNQALMRRERYERDGVYLPDENEGVHLPQNLDNQANSTGNRNNLTTETAGTSGFAAGTSIDQNTDAGESNAKDSATGMSSGNDMNKGSGTTNPTTGSSNKGG